MRRSNLKTTVPGPRSQAVFEERRKHVAPGPFHTTPIVAERAVGATITDVDGNTFLDFACGIGVTNLGHAEPSVVAAAKAHRTLFGRFAVLVQDKGIAAIAVGSPALNIADVGILQRTRYRNRCFDDHESTE
jgi:4-aminobutyrate aminotransferase-like enzyme